MAPPDNHRYSRQALFAPVGDAGQARIREARVLLVGCGALGTHLADFCVRAGVASLTIIDRDVLEASNLQRQALFTEADLAAALPKAVAATAHLRAINSAVEITAHAADFSHENAEELAESARATLILDASDNFETRFLINDMSVSTSIPWIYAGCVGSRAVAMPVVPGRTACLQCLVESVPPSGGETCDRTGIIMPAVLSAVALASAEALKLMSGNAAALIPRMKTVDIWTGERSSVDASTPRNDCPACARREFAWLSGRHATAGIKLCGRNSVQLLPATSRRENAPINLAALARELQSSGRAVTVNEHLLRVSDATSGGSAVPLELTLFADGRALVSGTTDAAAARALYARLLGG
jgi:molybdopterin/thiamine biosynthesis adenylyltransferase